MAVVAKAISVEAATAVQTVVMAISPPVPATASTTVSINSINDTADTISNNNSCSNSSDNGTSAGIASISDSGQDDDNGGNSNVGNGYRWGGIIRSSVDNLPIPGVGECGLFPRESIGVSCTNVPCHLRP